MEIFIFIAIVIFFLAVSVEPKRSTHQPNVSMNEITYPSDITCEKCNRRVRPTIKTIDTSTWDLKCDCGHIAYEHPKREERMKQLDDMLDW